MKQVLRSRYFGPGQPGAGLANHLSQRKIQIDLVVNNAGLAECGEFIRKLKLVL